MDNPLEQSAPEGVVERVHEFARDLAYGISQGLWKAELQLEDNWWRSGEYRINRLGINKYQFVREGNIQIEPENHDFFWLISSKWKYNSPTKGLLLSFGYIQLLEVTGGGEVYIPTQRAFELLDNPSKPPAVFISYSRRHSSTLALLIEARLKLVGVQNSFVDKNLLAGEEWHGKLENTIREAEYFVCLIGEGFEEKGKRTNTLESDMVKQEIAWAEQYGCTIISIWHGCKISADAPPALTRFNAIEVVSESAEAYENAVNKMLNSMRYATY